HDLLTDFLNTKSVLIQFYSNNDGLANAADSILQLQNTLISTLFPYTTLFRSFTIDGQLNVTASANNTIENFNTGTAGTSTVTFSNDGELPVLEAGTKLLLRNDVLNDFLNTKGGLIQVDGNKDGLANAADSILE